MSVNDSLPNAEHFGMNLLIQLKSIVYSDYCYLHLQIKWLLSLFSATLSTIVSFVRLMDFWIFQVNGVSNITVLKHSRHLI